MSEYDHVSFGERDRITLLRSEELCPTPIHAILKELGINAKLSFKSNVALRI